MKALRQVVIDYPTVAVAALLSIFGVAMVYSAGQTDFHTSAASAYRAEAIWLLAGFAAAYALANMPLRFVGWIAWPSYIFALFLLLALLVLGVGSGANGHTSSWLAIGGHRLGQPAEFAKLTVAILLATVLGGMQTIMRSPAELWKPMLVVGVPWTRMPFFGYGGSILLAIWLALGVLIRISGEGRGRVELWQGAA